MEYKCARFDTLSELTQFLNEEDVYTSEIVYIGTESGDFCLIYWGERVRNDVTPQPCEDTISRQAALNVIAKVGLLKNETKEVQAISECLREVEKLQPVKQETVTEFADRCRECGKMRTGHWIIMHDGKYSCDRCNCESPNNEKWDYCPNCGAEMGNRIDPKIGYKDCFQPKTEHLNIPFLMHKELEIPISECQKAYDVAIDYLRSQANVRTGK